MKDKVAQLSEQPGAKADADSDKKK